MTATNAAGREQADTLTAAAARPKVLFIVGWDRSGSTILDLVLGAVDGFFAVGELHHLWRRGIVEGRLCGCGAGTTECPVWAPILRQVHGRPPGVAEALAVVRTRERWLRVRRTWQILRDGGRGFEGYLALMDRTYRAAAGVTGSRVIVDASKDPSDAAALTLLPGVRPYFVHLVRDPRATAFSFRRRPKHQPDTLDGSPMPVQGAATSTRNWLIWNIGAERVRGAVPRDRSMFLRYEDFVRQPAASVERIVRMVGEPADALPFDDAVTAHVGGNHTVSGNPARFAPERVEIKDDAEWIGRQSTRDRIVASTIALPRLRRYGYPLFVPASAAPRGSSSRPAPGEPTRSE